MKIILTIILLNHSASIPDVRTEQHFATIAECQTMLNHEKKARVLEGWREYSFKCEERK